MRGGCRAGGEIDTEIMGGRDMEIMGRYKQQGGGPVWRSASVASLWCLAVRLAAAISRRGWRDGVHGSGPSLPLFSRNSSVCVFILTSHPLL